MSLSVLKHHNKVQAPSPDRVEGESKHGVPLVLRKPERNSKTFASWSTHSAIWKVRSSVWLLSLTQC